MPENDNAPQEERTTPMPTTEDEAHHDRRTPQEVRLTDQTITYLREQIAEAVADGIKTAIKETLKEESVEQFWLTGLSSLQKHATRKAGMWVLGSLWELVKKAFTIVCIVGFLYSVGGFSAIVTVGKAFLGIPAK